MKKLDQYLQDERDSLDVDAPPPAVWEAIEAQLHPKERKWPRLLRYAAIALLLMGVGSVITFMVLPNRSYYHDEIAELADEYSSYNYSLPITAPEPDEKRELPATGGSGIVDHSTSTHLWSSGGGSQVMACRDVNFASSSGIVGELNYEGFRAVRGNVYKTLKGEADAAIASNGANGGLAEYALYGWEYEEEGEYGFYDQAAYNPIVENTFASPHIAPVSTFSIDVDRASYANVRGQLNDDMLPDPNAVRIEEFINYFDYDYPQPTDEHPFSITTEIGDCPWNDNHKLVLVGLQGKEMPKEDLPKSNLVFLLDVSGSMDEPDKLPLLKESFGLLVEQLREEDRVAIVVYAGAAGVVLPPTPGNERRTIMNALDRLEAGGSTDGGEGIELAYKLADRHFIEGGNNRVILATDGDFNVGLTNQDALVKLIERKRESGVALSVLGFGDGNYMDNQMEQLADNGNGNCAYIDQLKEAEKVLVQEMSGTLVTIAKDVKLQLEFNPANVQSYRLIGYENRMLAKEDFDDDTKDAGELGAGHQVTALYEVELCGEGLELVQGSDLKYQNTFLSPTYIDEILSVKFRYKRPNEDQSNLLTKVLMNDDYRNSQNLKFAASVAEFGLILRGSAYRGNANLQQAIDLAAANKGVDANAYRQEFIDLIEQFRTLRAGL